MALAAQDDVEARLRRPLTTAEADALPGLLEEAEVLVLEYLRLDEEPDPLPRTITVMTSRIIARVFERDATPAAPGGDVESLTEGVGPFSRSAKFTAGSTSGGPWLSAADKVALRRHRADGMQSVAISTGRSGAYRTELP